MKLFALCTLLYSLNTFASEGTIKMFNIENKSLICFTLWAPSRTSHHNNKIEISPNTQYSLTADYGYVSLSLPKKGLQCNDIKFCFDFNNIVINENYSVTYNGKIIWDPQSDANFYKY